MAEVKLDISEYELMKEQAKLLKQSLKREKELSDKLDIVNKERIQALLDNEKNVTVINKVIETKSIVQRTHSNDIRNYLSNTISKVLVRILEETFNSSDPFRRSSIDFRMDDIRMGHRDAGRLNDREILHRILMNKPQIIEYVMRSIDFNPDQIHDMFFNKEKTETRELEPEIITKGLDDVKAEMKEIAFKELTKKAQEALTEIPLLKRERNDVVDELSEVKKDLRKAEKKIKTDEEIISLKESETRKLLEELSSIEKGTLENIQKISDINYVISNENGIFANKNRIIKIKQILENGSTK